MKYEFNQNVLNEYRKSLENKKNDQAEFYFLLSEIENALYTDMRRHYNDLKDYYTYEETTADYHEVMASIVQNARESDRELTDIMMKFASILD